MVAQSLVSPFILKHRDKDVKAYAACCLADILRIFAPEAPYGEEQLKVIILYFFPFFFSFVSFSRDDTMIVS